MLLCQWMLTLFGDSSSHRVQEKQSTFGCHCLGALEQFSNVNKPASPNLQRSFPCRAISSGSNHKIDRLLERLLPTAFLDG
jgi:hypothetical protein